MPGVGPWAWGRDFECAATGVTYPRLGGRDSVADAPQDTGGTSGWGWGSGLGRFGAAQDDFPTESSPRTPRGRRLRTTQHAMVAVEAEGLRFPLEIRREAAVSEVNTCGSPLPLRETLLVCSVTSRHGGERRQRADEGVA